MLPVGRDSHAFPHAFTYAFTDDAARLLNAVALRMASITRRCGMRENDVCHSNYPSLWWIHDVQRPFRIARDL